MERKLSLFEIEGSEAWHLEGMPAPAPYRAEMPPSHKAKKKDFRPNNWVQTKASKKYVEYAHKKFSDCSKKEKR